MLFFSKYSRFLTVLLITAFGCGDPHCPEGTERMSARGRCLDVVVEPVPDPMAADGGPMAEPDAALPDPPAVEVFLGVLPVESDLRVVVGGAVDLDIDVLRSPGLHGDVRLELTGLPPGLSASPAYVADSATEGTITVRAGTDARVGEEYAIELEATITGDSGATMVAPVNVLVAGLPGDLDVSFGARGTTITQPFDGTNDTAGGIAALPDGGFALTGYGWNGANTVAFITSYQEDGSVVGGFGTAGTRRFRAPGIEATTIRSLLARDEGLLVAIREDATHRVIRLDESGATDASFGGGTGAAQRPPTGRNNRIFPYDDGFMLSGSFTFERYDAEGVPVTSFGDLGVLPGVSAIGASLAALPDGGMIYGWHVRAGNFILERLDAHGMPQAAFGRAGRTSIPPATDVGLVTAVVPMDDGGVVAALLSPRPWRGVPAVRLVRLTVDGAVDGDFGVGGISAVLESNGPTVTAKDMFRVGDRLLVVGHHKAAGIALPTAYLVAYTLEGQVDTTFGTSGIVDLGVRTEPVAAIISSEADRILITSNHRAAGVSGIRDIIVQRVWL